MSAACAAAVVLLMDASSSILPQEWREQVDATAAALVSEQVLRSVEGGAGVAVTAIGFTEHVSLLAPWAVLETADDARRFAAALVAAPRTHGRYTDIAGALDHGLAALEAAPCEADRRVIDISTDGMPSAGEMDPAAVRDRAAAEGVTVNAIGVGDEVPEWLQENASTPGGFVVSSPTWADYAKAIAKKIRSELAGALP